MDTKNKELTTIQTDSGVFTIHPHRDKKIYSLLHRDGVHQKSDQMLLRSLLSSGDTVIDIGAHVGTFTIPFANAVGNTGRVLAFEVHPSTFTLLQKNVEQNNLSEVIHPLNIGLGSKKEKVYINETDSNTGGTFLSKESKNSDKYSVYVDTLDNVLDSTQNESIFPSLIKIDTEGFEYDVLLGAKNTIKKCKPILFFEFNPRRIQERGNSIHYIEKLLSPLGYSFYKNVDPQTGGGTFSVGKLFTLRQVRGFCDILAVPNDNPRLKRTMNPLFVIILSAWRRIVRIFN